MMIGFQGELVQSLTALVFPQYCPECKAEMSEGDGWACENCWLTLSPAGKGLWSERSQLQDRIFVAFRYNELARILVHQMKFYGREDIAIKLGRYAAEHLLLGGADWPVKAIIPVPLHPVRIRERGYNQNLALAHGVAEVTGLPIRTDLLKRVRHTSAQSRLSDKERLVNLRDAFEPMLSPSESIPSSFLIVDDVVHTGSTIIGCIEALKRHGQSVAYVIAACG